MNDLLMETIVGMLAEYETLDGEEMEVGIPNYGAGFSAEVKVVIGGSLFTITVKAVR